MMKKWLFILLACVGFAACSEDDINPSYADEERLEGLLDLSKPLVKEYKEKYGKNILYSFNDTLDFKFGFYTTSANTRWMNIVISHLDSTEVVDYALEKLDEMVFSYFNDDFKQLLPHKILLADIIDLGGTSNPDELMGESDVEEEGSVTVIANDYSYMFGFNKASMETFSESKLKNLRDVKLYHLIAYVLNKYDLYERIPDDFYSDVNYLYEQSIDSIAVQEEELPVGSAPYKNYYTPEWYMGLGMALTLNSPNKMATSSYKSRISVGESLYFPDKKRDFRNFVCVMIFTSESNLRTYYLPSTLFCQRMRIAMQVIQDLGVDILRINPALEMFQE